MEYWTTEIEVNLSASEHLNWKYVVWAGWLPHFVKIPIVHPTANFGEAEVQWWYTESAMDRHWLHQLHLVCELTRNCRRMVESESLENVFKQVLLSFTHSEESREGLQCSRHDPTFRRCYLTHKMDGTFFHYIDKRDLRMSIKGSFNLEASWWKEKGWETGTKRDGK